MYVKPKEGLTMLSGICLAERSWGNGPCHAWSSQEGNARCKCKCTTVAIRNGDLGWEGGGRRGELNAEDKVTEIYKRNVKRGP